MLPLYADMEGSPQIEWGAEQIRGVALFPDGVTPVANLPVRIWDVDRKKMIYRSRTADDGSFEVPSMKEGRFKIYVGRVKIDMGIVAAQTGAVNQAHEIVIVLTRPFLTGSSPEIFDVLIGAEVLQTPLPLTVVSP